MSRGPGATLNSQGSAGTPSASTAPLETIGTLNSDAIDLIAIAELLLVRA